MGGYVGLAKHFICSSCLNPIFRGSSGHWGQRLVLNKVAPPGGLRDESNHAITFQCPDCTGREPIVFPVVHPNGEVVNHFNISELVDHQDKAEVKREFGDYDNRQERAEINKQAQIKQIKVEPPAVKVEEEFNAESIPSVYEIPEEQARAHYKKTIEEIQEEHAQQIVDANKQYEEEDI